MATIRAEGAFDSSAIDAVWPKALESAAYWGREADSPDLSGQWADGLTPQDLLYTVLNDAGIGASVQGWWWERDPDKMGALTDEVCGAFEDAWHEAHTAQEA